MPISTTEDTSPLWPRLVDAWLRHLDRTAEDRREASRG